MTEIIHTFDRSTLEAWASCPQQAWLAARQRTAVGEIAVVGAEIHDAISRAIQIWIDCQGLMGIQDFVNNLEGELWSSRPDVQPDVVLSMRRSLWSFAKFLTNEHYLNIMRFDGGEGAKSGQLSHDFEGLSCRVTTELDLLMATRSKQEVDIWDWKSGWKTWRAADVAKSFQFPMQAWLVFENYPDVELVRVTIWNLRENRRTYAVEFFRNEMSAIAARVRSAAGYALMYGSATRTPPGWPTTEKCSLCSVAAKCTVSDETLTDMANDPETWVDRLVALETRTAAINKGLAKVVADRGTDIETAAGNCFGFNKPKKKTKPKAALYGSGETTSEDDAESTSSPTSGTNPFSTFMGK